MIVGAFGCDDHQTVAFVPHDDLADALRGDDGTGHSVHDHLATLAKKEAGHCQPIRIGADRRHSHRGAANFERDHRGRELAEQRFTVEVGDQHLHAGEGLHIAERFHLAEVVAVREGG